MTTIITATCLCGASKFSSSISNEKLPLEANFCHCSSCRHGTGTIAFAAAKWPEKLPDVSHLTQYAFSPKVHTYFCSTCGTLMFWDHGDEENPHVACGTLENPKECISYNKHIFLGDTKDGGCGEWLHTIAGKEQKRYRNAHDEALPLGWHADGDGQDHEEEDFLHAHCLCKGVEFRVTKPTAETANPEFQGQSDCSDWLDSSKSRYKGSVCVCDSCRLAVGVDFMTWTYIPTINLQLPDGSSFPGYDFGTLKGYRSSKEATRYFCGECGACIFFVADARPKLLDVAVGLFDAKSGSLAEQWLCWKTERVSFQEDGDARGALAEDIRQGLKQWEKQKSST